MSDTTKRVIRIITAVVLIAAVIGILAWATNWFRNWKIDTWFNGWGHGITTPDVPGTPGGETPDDPDDPKTPGDTTEDPDPNKPDPDPDKLDPDKEKPDDGEQKDPEPEPEPTVYTITFDANGGELTGESTLETNEDGKLETLPTDPTREDHTFHGWYTAVDGGDEITTNTTFVADTTVHAHWTENEKDPEPDLEPEPEPEPTTYTVTFDANGGTLTSSVTKQTNMNGKLDTLPTDPTREDHTFHGWYTAVDGGVKITVDHVFTSDATVYAIWEALPTYMITFNSNGGSTAIPDTLLTLTDGKLPTMPYDPVYSGYIFLGWFDALTQGEQVTTDTVFTDNITVYAYWRKAATYTITFDANGGSFNGSETVTLQTNDYGRITSFPSVSRTNYYVRNWKTEEGNLVTTSTVFTSNTTVYVQWYERSFNVDFDLNGGMIYDSYGNPYDSIVSCSTGNEFKLSYFPDETEFLRNGYKFDGWYDDIIGGRYYTHLDSFYADTTLYAHWKIDDFVFGNLGDNIYVQDMQAYSYVWNDSTSYREFKIAIVFDSPTTYSSFNISLSDFVNDDGSANIDIDFSGDGKFLIESIEWDYPDIDFGFIYQGLGGESEEFYRYTTLSVSEAFFDSRVYLVGWVTTRLSFCTNDELAEYVENRLVTSSEGPWLYDGDVQIEYQGFTRQNNFSVYIHLTNSEYAIQSVTFTDYMYEDIEIGTDYSQLLGGIYAFPISRLVNDSGDLRNIHITVSVVYSSDIPDYDQRVEGNICVVDLGVGLNGYICYYNSSDQVLSFEYFGNIYMEIGENLVRADIGIMYDWGFPSERVIPILRHYTYNGGGTIIFEWDGNTTATVYLMTILSCSEYGFTKGVQILNPDGLEFVPADFHIYGDMNYGVVYVFYDKSINLGEWDVVCFSSEQGDNVFAMTSGVCPGGHFCDDPCGNHKYMVFYIGQFDDVQIEIGPPGYYG